MRLISILCMLICFSACTQKVLKIAKPTEGPKELHVILGNDPLLITLELKSVLRQHGIESSFSTEEVRKSTIIDKENGESVIYKSSTDSPYRYQMNFSYMIHPVSNLVTGMVAQVWDSNNKEIIAKYSVRNLDWYLNADDAAERLYKDFISKLWP
jgi:hypothetical protein